MELFLYVSIILIVFKYHSLVNSINYEENPCSIMEDCSKCISLGECAWVLEDSLLSNSALTKGYSRCVLVSELKDIEASESHYVYPKSNSKTYLNESSGVDLLNVDVDHFDIEARQGLSVSFNFSAFASRDIELDLYFLLDKSTSVGYFVEKINNVSKNIVSTLLRYKTRIGVGYFVDIPVKPFINPTDRGYKSFLFKSVTPLTDNYENVYLALSNPDTFPSFDRPEAMLDALNLVAMCKNIQWSTRPKTKRIVFVVSQFEVKYAGHGAIIGQYKPNDGSCKIGKEDTVIDYDSDYIHPFQVYRSLSLNDIKVFLFVSKYYEDYYNIIMSYFKQQSIGMSFIEGSEEAAIENSILDASTNKESFGISLSQLPSQIEAKIYIDCGEGYEDRTTCIGIPANKKVHFLVKVKLLECVDKKINFNILVNDRKTIPVNIQPLCKCDCELEINHNPDRRLCTSRGKSICGECSCDEGFEGKFCECILEESRANCTFNNKVCNDQGKCLCGKCKCFLSSFNFYGDKCQCSDKDCPRTHSGLCDGTGTCKCNKCKCTDDKIGDDCSSINCQYKPLLLKCVMEEDRKKYIDTDVNLIPFCNKNGSCNCGECECLETHYGRFCENIIYPTLFCDNTDKCLIDHILKYPTEGQNCHGLIEEKDDIPNVSDPFKPLCTIIIKDCKYTYVPFFTYNNKITSIKLLKFIKSRDCSKKLQIWAIILIAVGVIVLSVIIFIILLYAAYYYLYEKRMYKKLLVESQQSKWTDVDNPLYLPVSSNFDNPVFRQNSEEKLENI